VGPLVSLVRNDHAGLKRAMTRTSGSVHTKSITNGYAQSFNSLVALRYLLRLRSKQTDTPEVVKAANVVTRSGKTRRDNAATLAPLSDRNTGDTEAAVNGQGSNSAGNAVQNAAILPQGSPVTGVTPKTNPVGPPIGEGVSTG
jgi:hypothetical protein